MRLRLKHQPFLPESSPLQSFFPAREWAVRLPVLLLLSGMIGVSLFFGKVAMAEARKKRRSAGKAA
jgi:dolichyl-phosphate mannosyltransferase polypeptide 2 regulatory subunit